MAHGSSWMYLMKWISGRSVSCQNEILWRSIHIYYQIHIKYLLYLEFSDKFSSEYWMALGKCGNVWCLSSYVWGVMSGGSDK